MANNWAIAIGINQYQFFQPLGCAQADAEAMKDFLVTNGGFLPQHCLLMTETSPPFGERSTYPTKENILLLLEDFASDHWRAQDHLLFFFSGYGVNHKGQDYLMPVEGDPNSIEQTGLEIRAFMQSLQVAALDVLLLLDINRAFGTHADARVGKETIELAKELQITTILSCQPDEFSHESRELGHGFFTAALLEALRYGNGSNLTNLEKYLSLRTPELCQHYWRPTQNPITIFVPKPQMVSSPSEDKSNTLKEVVGGVETGSREQGAGREITSSSPLSPSSPRQSPQVGEPAHGAASSSPSSHPQKRSLNHRFLPQLLVWSAVTMLTLCLILVFLFRDTRSVKPPAYRLQRRETDRSRFNSSEVLPATSKTTTDNTKTVSGSPKPSPTPLSTVVAQPKSPTIPQVTTTPDAQQQKQALLELEKMSLRPTQASELRQAINRASKIPPDQPEYAQAQENIKIWSQMILDLAQSRAKQRLYPDAISAAQLIPKDQPPYTTAQASIKQWRLQAKQYVSNMTLIDAAVALIRFEQASSYNRAIELAKKVPQGEPGFDIAQKSIDTWSENILRLAKKRAARKDFKAAIATATLVPEGTSPYKEAQNVIALWQKNSQ
jgi:hypothetical protein